MIALGFKFSNTPCMISVLSSLLSNLFCSVSRKGTSDILNSHCSSSVKQFSLSSHSKSLSCVASESCLSFMDSSSLACSSSVISCIIVAVSFALSCNLLLKLDGGPDKVVALAATLTTFFFPFQGA